MRAVICFLLILVFLSFAPQDSIPPVINCEDEIFSYVGESILLRSQISVFDNMTNSDRICVSIDTQHVSIDKCGRYPVTVYATDLQGNVSTKNLILNVIDRQTSTGELAEMIEDILKEIIYGEMSDEEKCRRIYSYVKEKISYREISKRGDEISAAYYGLIYGFGDCYTFYAVTKELLDACGIENMCIERARGFTTDTHIWNLVKINGEWYHLDCTHLYPDVENMGCLMTETQLYEYCKFRKDATGRVEDWFFYCYDKSIYPEISKKKITEVGKGAYKKYTAIS